MTQGRCDLHSGHMNALWSEMEARLRSRTYRQGEGNFNGCLNYDNKFWDPTHSYLKSIASVFTTTANEAAKRNPFTCFWRSDIIHIHTPDFSYFEEASHSCFHIHFPPYYQLLCAVLFFNVSLFFLRDSWELAGLKHVTLWSISLPLNFVKKRKKLEIE